MADTQLTPEQQAEADAKAAAEEKAAKERADKEKKAESLRAELAKLEKELGPPPEKKNPLQVQPVPKDSSATAHSYGGKFYTPGQVLDLNPKDKDHAALIEKLKAAKVLPFD